jgi:hypothetical protein
MVDKILKVSTNLVYVYFTDRPTITIATEDGTAMRKALDIQVEMIREDMKKREEA